MTTVTEPKRIKEHDQPRRLSFPFSFPPEPPSSRRTSIIKEPVELHDDVNLGSLEAFLEEILDLHSYGVALLKVLKQKYIQIFITQDTTPLLSASRDSTNLKDKIKYLRNKLV